MAESDSKSGDQTVIIRLLEKKDDPEVTRMIWQLIFLHTAMDLIKDKLFKKRFLFLYSICGLFGYLDQYLLSEAFLCFVTPLCTAYLIIRYIMLPYEYYGNYGIVSSPFEFWSQTCLGRRFWVAEIDGQLAGTIALEILSPTTAQIFRLSVKNGFRGKGIGKTLVDTTLRHCRSRGFEHAVLVTSYVQVSAQILYEKMGFRVVQCTPHGPQPHYFFGFNIFTYHFSPTGKPPGFWGSPEGAKAIY